MTLLEYANEGATWCMTPGAPDIKEALPYTPSSDAADAWLIGAWCQYWGGQPPREIRRFRGHCLWVMTHRCQEHIMRIKNPFDHREGVELA